MPLIFALGALGLILLNTQGHFKYFGCVYDTGLSKYKSRAEWLFWLLTKGRPFVFKYKPPWSPHTSRYGAYLPLCVGMINTYHHTKPATCGCFGCSSSRPFILKYRPLEPTYFVLGNIFTAAVVWLTNSYHHIKPESKANLAAKEKAGPLYSKIGPWGPQTSTYGLN